MDNPRPIPLSESPDHPRLVASCRLFEDDERLVLRSVWGAFAIEPVHRPAMERILGKLDGRHDIAALLGGESPADAFYALRMLDWFVQSHLVVEGPPRNPNFALPAHKQADRLNGVPLILAGHGWLAQAMLHRFPGVGASADRGDVAAASARGAVLIACPDGPDLAGLERMNLSALAMHASWLPVFPFGDAIMAGPLIRPGRTPCFRCFELRWLGLSPAIALERAYFDLSRRGDWHQESPDQDTVGAIASFISLGLVPELLCHAVASDSAKAFLVPLETGSASILTVERHPQCEACAPAIAPDHRRGAATGADWFRPGSALAEVARNLAPLADRRCGLAAIMPMPRHHVRTIGLPEVAVARFALPAPESLGGAQDNWCHGSAERREDAETLATVEALERYAGLSPAAICLRSSYAAVAERALLPTDLPLFSPAQYSSPGFPFRRFDPEQPLNWSEGFNITRGTPVLVPSSAAWYGQDDSLLSETSSGVAAHSSLGLALLNGAFEVIERDAFMIHWLNRLSPPLIDLDQLEDPLPLAIAVHVRESGYTLRVADLTTDLEVPVRLALGFREDRMRPALVVGAGASLDPAKALDRALRELYAAVSSHTPLWTLPPARAMRELKALDDHHRAYEHPDWLPHAAFLWSSARRSAGQPSRVPARGLDDLATLIDSLASHGHNLIGVDITSPDIRRHGVWVVRAIIPGLQPLGFGEHLRLGGRRLYEAPVRMGRYAAPIREVELNRVPHCFP